MDKKRSEYILNSSDYDYLDSLPFEGWLWEFIRRSKEYQAKFEEYLEELGKWIHSGLFDEHKKRFTPSEQKNIEKQLKLLHRMLDEVEEKIGVGDEAFMTPDMQSRKILRLFDHYAFIVIPIQHPVKEYLQNAKKKNLLDQHYRKKIAVLGKMIAWGRGIPRPDIKYYQFKKTLYPIIRTDFMKCYTYEQIYNDIDHPVFGKVDISPLEMLSPTKPEDTIYIGISKKSNIKDIEKVLIPEIRKHLVSTRSRIRIDKWKYYLIVYDMKQKDMSYSEISEVMYQTYTGDEKQQGKLSENAFDVRTIENYHKSALALVAGGFKKYLQITK